MIQRTTSRRTPSRTALRRAYAQTNMLRYMLMLIVVSGVLVGSMLVASAYRGISIAQRPAPPQAAAVPRQDVQVDTPPSAAARSITYKVDPKTTAYVVERDRMGGTAPVEQGQILAVDTASLQITGRIDTLYDPQVALAPDGTSLYIAETDMSGNTERDQLRVIDTAMGRTTATVAIPGRFRSTVFVSLGVLAVSQQGRYVYVENMPASDGGRSSFVTYDVVAGRMLPTEMMLPEFCNAAMLWPLPADGTVAAVCLGPAHSVSLASVLSGQVTTIAVPDAPGFINGIPKGGLATALVGSVLAPDGSAIYIVNKSGTVHRFDVAARRFLPSMPLAIGHGQEVLVRQVQLSRDGQRLYLGVARPDVMYTGNIEQVQVYDTATWKQVRTVPLAAPVRSFALTPDEQLLMLDTKARAVSKAVPVAAAKTAPAVAPAPTVALDTPGNQLDAIVTLP